MEESARYPQQWGTIKKVHHMANRDSQGRLGATDEGLRLADYALGSAQSRAAARAYLLRVKVRTAGTAGTGFLGEGLRPRISACA